jgi:hypothetical protein
MRIATLIGPAAVLLLSAIPLGAQQQEQVDPTVKILRDSLAELRTKRAELETALTQSALPIPRIQGVDTLRVFANRAFIRVDFQGSGIGRVRVTLRSTDSPPSSTPRPIITSNLAASHTVEVTGLIENTEYTGTVEILTHSGDTPAAGRDPFPIKNFITPRQADRPVASVGVKTATASTAAIRAAANQDALFRVLLFGQNASGGPTSAPLRAFGDEYSLTYGAPTGGTPGREREIPLTGLSAGRTYYVRAIAMNAQGRADTTDFASFQTRTREFGFDGPVRLVLSPARGLVVSWRATAPADSAFLRVPFSNAKGYQMYEASATDSTTYTATVPYTDVQSIPAPTPTAAPPATPPGQPASTNASGPVLTMLLYPRGGGAPNQIQIAMTVEVPQVNSWKAAGLTDDQKRDLEHVYRQAVGGKLPDTTSLLRSGLKAFAKVAPVVLGAI